MKLPGPGDLPKLIGWILIAAAALYITSLQANAWWQGRKARHAAAELAYVEARKAEIEAYNAAQRRIEELEEARSREELRRRQAEEAARRARRDVEAAEANVARVVDEPCDVRLGACESLTGALRAERESILRVSESLRVELGQCDEQLGICQEDRERMAAALEDRDIDLRAERRKPKRKWWQNRVVCGPGLGAVVGPTGEINAGVVGGCVVRLF